MNHDGLFLKILAIETRAARLEGAFAADPDLGAMWRAGAGLTEACRSVALEDIHVHEGDVVHRGLENAATGPETARGVESVLRMLRVVAAPGDLLKDPEEVLLRCWTAAVSAEADIGPAELRAAAGAVRAAMADAPTPFLGALRAAVAFRTATWSAAPSADRLVFLAAEHALRRPARASDPCWIFTPSVALSQGGFRAWSPGTGQGLADLVDGIGPELGRAIGTLPLLRRWRETSREIAERRNARSRLRDLVALAAREPLLTPARLRTALDVSRRASFTLVDEAAAEGILTLITPRRSWRVWARPDMAARVAMRTPRAGVSRPRDLPEDRAVSGEVMVGGTLPPTHQDRDSRDAADAEILEALDAAMKRADAVLAKHAARR